jgi:hypothetical protein
MQTYNPASTIASQQTALCRRGKGEGLLTLPNNFAQIGRGISAQAAVIRTRRKKSAQLLCNLQRENSPSVVVAFPAFVLL